jgi:hypothetical protein
VVLPHHGEPKAVLSACRKTGKPRRAEQPGDAWLLWDSDVKQTRGKRVDSARH